MIRERICPTEIRNRYNPPHWPEEGTPGKYAFRQFFRKSGFAVLKVDDSGYAVEYCIGEGHRVPLVYHPEPK